MKICQAPGCDRPVRSTNADWCERDYYRLRRNGTLEARSYRDSRGICRIDGCDLLDCGPHELCPKHNARLRRYGDPEYSPGWKVMLGPDNPTWRGDDVGYFGAHARVIVRRGAASAHSCIDCGGRAAQWSYDRTDPDEKRAPEGPYSPDPDRYAPRCVPCHKHFDLDAIAAS